MNQIVPIKKLFRIAVFTSTAIGIITIGPAFLIGMIFGNISTTITVILELVLLATVGITLIVFLFWSINIALFHFENRCQWMNKRKKFRYLAGYLVGLFLLISVRLSLIPLMNNEVKIQEMVAWKSKLLGIQLGNIDYLQFNKFFIQILIIGFVVVSINTVVIVILDLVLLYENRSRIETENHRLKMMNVEAANQKLKQQLQPHFLFNSLNVLKTLIRRKPDQAEAYLKRLSDFLRASVSYDHLNKVSIKEELKLSIDYIEMQKIRFEEAIRFEIEVPEAVQTGFLPLFSIQLLLENAIKHNSFTIESPLCIRLFYRNGFIIVSNNIQQKNVQEPSSGMGLMNLSERYKIISGDELVIQSDDSTFTVSLKILEHGDRNH